MKNHHFQCFSLIGGLFILAACSHPPREDDAPLPQQKHPDYQVKNLPINSQWRQFQCREGSFSARFADSGQKILQLRDQYGTHRLEREPSYDPVVYQDGRLALFANEREVVVGRPESPMIIFSGCQAH